MIPARARALVTLLVTACGQPSSQKEHDASSVATATSDGRESNDARANDRRTGLTQVVAGEEHTCVLFTDGTVRCWGAGASGRLGIGSEASIGDDEPVSAGRDVDLGGPAQQLAAGAEHTCALMRTGVVRCWGTAGSGRLGYGNTKNVGVDITPAQAGDVQLGEPAVQIAAGWDATCAVLASGSVRCWGEGDNFRLGYGDDGPWKDDVGDDEAPASLPPLQLQRKVKQVALAGVMSCALFDNGGVRCWGATEGNPHDFEHQPARARRDVRLGTRASALGAGNLFICATTTKAKLRCWGVTYEFGFQTLTAIGPNAAGWPTPARLGDVPTLSDVEQVVGGDSHACVLHAGGRVRCWGDSRFGQTGRGNSISHVDLGDAVDLELSAPARQIAAGDWHTCALLEDNTVRCWGSGDHGRLGYGNTENVYDAAHALPIPL